jgi:hypothetical protein
LDGADDRRINELEQQHKELEATLDARSKALKTYQSRVSRLSSF